MGDFQALQGIRLLKYYTWEEYYAGKIKELRAKELAAVRVSA